MKFFDRTEEITTLRATREQARRTARFTVVTGRRRIGKTSLVLRAYADEPFLYFFVARKAESELCEDYRREIEEKLGLPTMGRTSSFVEIFEYLMKLSASQPITLFIDEFQEFFRVNKSIFSDMQRIWDLHAGTARLNLVVCGSIYTMMTKIFKDRKEPLYNRQTAFMTVRPFKPSVLKEILAAHHPGYTPEDLLALYAFTGGVAKYVQLLMDAGAVSRKQMLAEIVKADSIFLGEGKAVLVEEFGRDYGVYFSILSAIARGKTTRAEVEAVVGREISGYLTKLEKEYEVISKKQPLFERSTTKNVRYTIEDNFFTFWFRFIYKYNYMLEIEAYDRLRTIINRDYETFSGLILERYFKRAMIERQAYTRLGGWWDRKGENEIDLIAEDEIGDEATFFEIKRRAENIDLAVLKEKAAAFQRATGAFKDYKLTYAGLSLADM